MAQKKPVVQRDASSRKMIKDTVVVENVPTKLSRSIKKHQDKPIDMIQSSQIPVDKQVCFQREQKRIQSIQSHDVNQFEGISGHSLNNYEVINKNSSHNFESTNTNSSNNSKAINTSIPHIYQVTNTNKPNINQVKNTNNSQNIPNKATQNKTSMPIQITSSQFISFNPHIKEYFSQLNVRNDCLQKVNVYQRSVLDGLDLQLTDGRLSIQKCKPFVLKNKLKGREQEQQQKVQKQQQTMQKLQFIREQALMKLKQVQLQELQLKRHMAQKHQRPLKRSSSLQISRLPQYLEKAQLKKALRQYKKFNKQLESLQYFVVQQSQKNKKIQAQKQQELVRLRRQSKKQQITNKNSLKQIMDRQKVIKFTQEQQKANNKVIRNTKYLYLQYQQKQLQLQEQKEQQKLQFLSRIRRHNKFDREEIQEHQRKYQTMMQERRQYSKSLFSSNISSQLKAKKYQTSRFKQITLRQIQQLKKRQIQRSMKVKQVQYKQKITKYQQKIDKQIKPSLHYKKFVPLPRCISMVVLSAQKQRQLGIGYLQKAKKLKKTLQELKISQLKKQEEQQLILSQSKNIHKDYLKDVRKQLKYDPTQERINQILNRKSILLDYESLNNAKYLSEFLVQKSKITSQGKTMLAIRKKMEILNSIS